MLESRGLLLLCKKERTVQLKMEPANADRLLRQDRIACNILTSKLS